MSIGVVHFPCPKCSTPSPIAVTQVHEHSHFTCANVTCGFKRLIGTKFPSVKELLERFSMLDPEIARAKIVDKLTAWYLDWSDLRD